MRKIIIIISLFYLSSSQMFSQESGWYDFGSYQYQQLKINNLSTLAVSQDNSNFSSYHSDDKILVWDLLSGKLIDSIVLNEIPQLFFFSKDGKTAVTSNYSSYDNVQTIRIIDLAQKKLIAMDTINFWETFKSVDFRYNSILNSNYLFDFVTDDSLLIIKNQSEYGGTYGAGDLHWGHSGFLGFCEVINGNIIFKSQVSDKRVFDYFRSDSITYFCYDKDFWNNSNFSYTNYGFATISDNDSIQSIIIEYYTKFLVGDELKILRIFFDNHNNTIIFKSDSKLQYYDINQMSIISGKSIRSITPLLQYDQKRNILITNEDGYFYYYNVLKPIVLDSLVSPIITNGFIISNEPSIIAYNRDGEIIKILYGNINSIKYQKTNRLNISISPNPASEYIEISLNRWTPSARRSPSVNEGIKIYNTYGECVITLGNADLRSLQKIDISNLPIGIYFIQIGNSIEKFMVVR